MRLFNHTVYYFAAALRRFGIDLNEENDPRVVEMKRAVNRLGGKIEFKIEQYPDGFWTAESTNLDGIITGSAAIPEMPALIRDAIFTYFAIPPHLCNPALLKADHEPVTTRQRVYV
ncbi:MAG: hypothetical protein HYV42_05915 [Candidatus Magasanikbacteria bacterium]|nr:hypothetical protein [Candidatus Magasanikbacteria bacterium]